MKFLPEHVKIKHLKFNLSKQAIISQRNLFEKYFAMKCNHFIGSSGCKKKYSL